MKDIPFKNMSRYNRIQAKLDGVESKVNYLKGLGLIEEKGMRKASRGERANDESKFHSFWIFTCMDHS